MSVKTETATVSSEARRSQVFLNVHDDEFGETYTFMTPQQARLAAYDLIAAADAADASDEQ